MKSLLSVILFAICVSNVFADVRLPDVIGSSMVLQQKMAVPIWGTAEVGEAVTIVFFGQKKTVVAGPDGKWRVDLGKLSASFKPQTMTITGKNTIELKDILVGEVWLVSGQSNMQRLLRETDNGAAVQAEANHPNIRLFNSSREVAFKKKQGKLGEWVACTPESMKEFSAAGYYFGVDLQKELNVPVGLLNSSYGGSQAEAWTPVAYLNASPDLKPTVDRTEIWKAEREQVRVNYTEAIKKWREDQDKAKARGVRPSPSPGVPDALRDYRIASSIYDGMIEPLMPFAIRGAAWYQGESNEARAEQYNLLLPTMIKAWRERWGEGDFAFGIIQLPNYRRINAEPEEAAWSFIREAQRQTSLSIPNTGLIVTIDIGEASDIHPKNKVDVGKRMLAWALKDVYGRKIATSPVLKKTEVKGGKIILTFDDVGSGLTIRKGDKLKEFAIAGADEKWFWAEAKIVGKNKVEVSSAKVAGPVAVRYAFNSNPQNPNLTNDSGFPASPFRTDTWTNPTAGKR
ncbi:MAG TPA: sialate O-acetylesterase, partial [Pyrinomonadaceae bacterium]|nr:sialate O-acetylesterase [Pyrinomonadaceae bacterium]